MLNALIIGATGATGKDLVKVLLQDSSYSEVVVFVRRSTGINHPRLAEIIVDFDNLEQVADRIKGDVFFSCLGTTLKAAGSKVNQRHIDFEIPLKFAEIAKRNGVHTTVLLSAYGAKANSSVFYSALKGELEERYQKLGFDRCIIFKPGMLLRENTDRLGERIGSAVINGMNALGILRKFKPLPTFILAEKLAKAPTVVSNGLHIIELNDIRIF